MNFRSLFLLAAGAALLAACDSASTDDTGEDKAARNAKGEVLGGTISDDMIPLERLRSQSPPLREVRASATDSAGTAEADDSDADDAGTESDTTQAAPAAGEPADD